MTVSTERWSESLQRNLGLEIQQGKINNALLNMYEFANASDASIRSILNERDS